MKHIIAGSRNLYPSYAFIRSSIKMFELYNLEEIVCGSATGVDSEGEHFASHMMLPVKYFPADWEKDGKAAGAIRNKKMAEYADALLLIHNGSNGSLNMKKEMLKLKKPVYEILLIDHQKD